MRKQQQALHFISFPKIVLINSIKNAHPRTIILSFSHLTVLFLCISYVHFMYKVYQYILFNSIGIKITSDKSICKGKISIATRVKLFFLAIQWHTRVTTIGPVNKIAYQVFSQMTSSKITYQVFNHMTSK